MTEPRVVASASLVKVSEKLYIDPAELRAVYRDGDHWMISVGVFAEIRVSGVEAGRLLKWLGVEDDVHIDKP